MIFVVDRISQLECYVINQWLLTIETIFHNLDCVIENDSYTLVWQRLFLCLMFHLDLSHDQELAKLDHDVLIAILDDSDVSSQFCSSRYRSILHKMQTYDQRDLLKEFVYLAFRSLSTRHLFFIRIEILLRFLLCVRRFDFIEINIIRVLIILQLILIDFSFFALLSLIIFESLSCFATLWVCRW